MLNTIHESYEYIPIRSSYILQLHRDLYKYSEKTKEKYYAVLEQCGNGWHEAEEDPIPFVKYML